MLAFDPAKPAGTRMSEIHIRTHCMTTRCGCIDRWPTRTMWVRLDKRRNWDRDEEASRFNLKNRPTLLMGRPAPTPPSPFTEG